MELSFVYVLVLALFIQSSSAIRCFICQSRSNPSCRDPMAHTKLQLTECTPSIIHASSRELARAMYGLGGISEEYATQVLTSNTNTNEPMQCQKISYNIGEERVVIRGCHAGAAWNPRSICRVLDDQSRSTPNAYINYCDTCDRDACNGAQRNKRISSLFAYLSILIPTIVTAILKY